jgi:Uma2 family endonuclease
MIALESSLLDDALRQANAQQRPLRLPMTRAAFLALPEANWVVEYMDRETIVSPAPNDDHQAATFDTGVYLRDIFPADAGLIRLSPLDVHLDDETTVQPDIFGVTKGNPSCTLGKNRQWHGAPDLVIEVLSPSTAFRDRGEKYKQYERAGVREYWLIDLVSAFVKVYRRAEGKFERAGVFGQNESFVTTIVEGVTVQVNPLILKENA